MLNSARTNHRPAAAKHSPRRRASGSPLSADLAGRTVRLSPDVPASFDAPLADHHKMIGHWAVAYADPAERFTRPEVRRHIEQTFNAAVLGMLEPVTIAKLRVVALHGGDDLPPALALICDDVGQLDMGWIEQDSTLAAALTSPVAPLGWRAKAYQILVETLPRVLPIITWDGLFDELSGYHWNSETTDAAAIEVQMKWHGIDIEDIDEEMLPSAVLARRPDWMLEENADPLKDLPRELAARLRRLRAAHTALKAFDLDRNAFRFADLYAYVPDYEDHSHLGPLTLVPFDHFAREIDEIAQHGMEYGFTDVAGLCPIADADAVEAWFASLKLGVELIVAAQALIETDPVKEYRRHG